MQQNVIIYIVDQIYQIWQDQAWVGESNCIAMVLVCVLRSPEVHQGAYNEDHKAEIPNSKNEEVSEVTP